MQPPQPPQRSSRRRIIWGIVILAVAGLLIFLIGRIVKLGENMGEKMAKGSKEAFRVMDSLMSVQQDTAKYNRLYAQLDEDTATADARKKLEHFQQLSDGLYQELADLTRRYKDTIESAKVNRLFDKRVSNYFFIRSGRATQLKQHLIDYRRQAILGLPPGADTTQLMVFVMIEESKDMPAMLRKLMKWETINFDQPPQTVFANLDRIRWEVTMFESSVLESYSGWIGPRTYSRADSLSTFVP